MRRARRLLSTATSLAVAAGLISPALAHGTVPADATAVAFGFTFVPGDTDLNRPLGIDTLTITQGQGLGFVNLDSNPHNITAIAAPNGDIAFASKTVTLTDTLRGDAPTDVVGVRDLGPGRYPFQCVVHPQMQGVLVVTAS